MPAQGDLLLPPPGQMVALSTTFNPAVLKGIKLDPNNPFRFHFYVDQGDGQPGDMFQSEQQNVFPPPEADQPMAESKYMLPSKKRNEAESTPGKPRTPNQAELKIEANKLIKYFLASLTIPETDLWVNLSPYEKDRIIPQEFGQTEMGRDLLAQDYILKQITASLIYPESKLGKEFWQTIYTQAQAKYGTKNIPINTFNKVWIVPEKAVLYENGGTAFVLENHLKVMLEEDYLAQSKNNTMSSPNAFIGDPAFAKQIIREIVIPALTKEVNEGKNFAQLRQVFYSLILATWYKKKVKDSILNKIYSNQKKLTGVQYDKSVIASPKGVAISDVDNIYQQYLQAFKKGVYNYIKEEPNPITGQTIPRKYFSGGVNALKMDQAIIAVTHVDAAQFKKLGNLKLTDALVVIEIDRSKRNTIAQRDRAMSASAVHVLNDEELLVQYLKEKNQKEFFILLDKLKKQSNEKLANSFTKLLINAPYKTAFLIGLVLIDLDDADRKNIADQLLNEISDAKKVYQKLQSIRKGIPEIPANYKLILTVEGLIKIFHGIALFHQEEASIRLHFGDEILNQDPLIPSIIRNLLSLDPQEQAEGLKKVKLLGVIPEGVLQLIADKAFFNEHGESRALAQKFLNDVVAQGRYGSKKTKMVLKPEEDSLQSRYTQSVSGFLLRTLRDFDEFTGAVPDDLLIVLMNYAILPRNMELLDLLYRVKHAIPAGMKDRVEYVPADKLLSQQVASDFSFIHDINDRFARVLSYLKISLDAQIMNFGSGTNMVKLSQWPYVLNVDNTAYVSAAKLHAESINAQFSSQPGKDPYDVVLMHHWGMFGPPRSVEENVSFWQKTWKHVKPGGWLVLMIDPNYLVPWEMEKFLGEIQLANIPELPAKVIMVPNDNQSTARINPYMVIAIQRSPATPAQSITSGFLIDDSITAAGSFVGNNPDDVLAQEEKRLSADRAMNATLPDHVANRATALSEFVVQIRQQLVGSFLNIENTGEVPEIELVADPKQKLVDLNRDWQRYGNQANRIVYWANQYDVRIEFLKLVRDYQLGTVNNLGVFEQRLKDIHRVALLGHDGLSVYTPPTMRRAAQSDVQSIAGKFSSLMPDENTSIVYADFKEMMKYFNMPNAEIDRKKFIAELSRFYSNFLGHWQATGYMFEYGNNSLAMNMVNCFLRLANLKGISHGNLDMEASVAGEAIGLAKILKMLAGEESLIISNDALPPIHESFSNAVDVANRDGAMIIDSSNRRMKNTTTGGIDLNPTQMKLQVNNGSPISAGGGSAFGVDIDVAQVTGASFTILQMTPVTNLLEILALPASI